MGVRAVQGRGTRVVTLSLSSAEPQLPEPRVLLVLAGAATARTATATALERASLPSLAAMAERGRTARLRAIAPHLPAEELNAYPTLLGTAVPSPLDRAAVAGESCGAVLSAGERCALVEVLDHAGEPAPALHVARAVEVLRGQLPQHRIAAVRRGNEVLLAGLRRPVMPEVGGLELRLGEEGWLPSRPLLDASTVVVASAGASILGVARLLGARAVAVDPVRSGPADPVPARLRSAATQALLDGARTVVVESAAALLARRGMSDEVARERAVGDVLARLDRELIGPLHTAAAWQSAAFVVTADLARRSAGPPAPGEVPMIVAGDRQVPAAPPASRPAVEGTLLPPRYSERGVLDRPIVTSPFTVPPVRDPDAPLRFRRDPASGVTVPELA